MADTIRMTLALAIPMVLFKEWDIDVPIDRSKQMIGD